MLRTIEAGAELEFDGNLIQVEELKSSGSGEGPASQVLFLLLNVILCIKY